MRPLPAPQPDLHSERVRLRPFTLTDAGDVQRLAGDPRVAETTLHIPCPYPDGVAESFIATHAEAYARTRSVIYAIADPASDALVGGIGLELDVAANAAEVGYWIAHEHWGKGFASDALRALLSFALGPLELDLVRARHIVRNPASGRVMEKLGMRFERSERDVPWRAGTREDYVFRVIHRTDWTTR